MAAHAPSSRHPVTNSHVRRNLFNHLSRRPTTSTSTSATTMPEIPPDDSGDILVRDRDGRIKVHVPILPMSEEDHTPAEGEGEGGGAKDRLEPRYIDMYRKGNLPEAEATDLLAVVQASLRRKVASLDADNWMFESEEEPKT